MFDWIRSTVESTGALAVALLMLAENVFPPIPSELIMPLAGFTAAQGKTNVVVVFLAGLAGSLAGATLWYFVGSKLGAERLKRWADKHGRWLTLSPQDVDKACAWFGRHGGKAVLIGRLVPGVRTLISLPAGFAGMPLAPFLAYSAVGTAIWTALLTGAGYVLEASYDKVAGWTGPVSNAVFGVLVAWYLYRVATFRREGRH